MILLLHDLHRVGNVFKSKQVKIICLAKQILFQYKSIIMSDDKI